MSALGEITVLKGDVVAGSGINSSSFGKSFAVPKSFSANRLNARPMGCDSHLSD